MTKIESIFIEIVKRCINNEITEDLILDARETENLLVLSYYHQLLPMVYDYAFKASMLNVMNEEDNKKWQKKALSYITREIVQTNELLNLIVSCQNKGFDPVIVKGIICRNIYPIPFVRTSTDEDFFVMHNEVDFFNDFLLDNGLFLDKKYDDIHCVYELSYHKKDSPTYIELHTNLFDPEAKGYANLNKYFEQDIFQRTDRILIDDVYVRTLPHTEHMLFLIFHAYKHFIYSGVGIRPVCDVGMYAKTYGVSIDWKYIRWCLEEENIFYFSKALFNIIRQYLLPNESFFDYIADWSIQATETDDLLNDILKSGVLGNSSKKRLNTSNMTLSAIEGNSSNLVLKSLFPSVRKLQGRYSFLKKYPVLLPVAWVDRIVVYFKYMVFEKNQRPLDSAMLGKERIELLRQYHIIK